LGRKGCGKSQEEKSGRKVEILRLVLFRLAGTVPAWLESKVQVW
jgi:hypothetical protein